MQYIIDLTDVVTVEKFYEAVVDGLDTPDYFGNNLDALYDVLTEMGEESEVIFKNVSDFLEANPEYGDSLNEMLDDATVQNENLSITFEDIEEYTLEELEAMGLDEYADMDDTEGLEELDKL